MFINLSEKLFFSFDAPLKIFSLSLSFVEDIFSRITPRIYPKASKATRE